MRLVTGRRYLGLLGSVVFPHVFFPAYYFGDYYFPQVSGVGEPPPTIKIQIMMHHYMMLEDDDG